MNEKDLKQAMDRRLSPLRVQQRHVAHVLRNIQGEEPMKKKTVPLALVFAIIAVAGIAIAAVLSPTIDFFSNLYAHLDKEQYLDYETDLKGGIRMPVMAHLVKTGIVSGSNGKLNPGQHPLWHRHHQPRPGQQHHPQNGGLPDDRPLWL